MNFSDMILKTYRIGNSNLNESELTYILKSSNVEELMNLFLKVLNSYDSEYISGFSISEKDITIIHKGMLISIEPI